MKASVDSDHCLLGSPQGRLVIDLDNSSPLIVNSNSTNSLSSRKSLEASEGSPGKLPPKRSSSGVIRAGTTTASAEELKVRIKRQKMATRNSAARHKVDKLSTNASIASSKRALNDLNWYYDGDNEPVAVQQASPCVTASKCSAPKRAKISAEKTELRETGIWVRSIASSLPEEWKLSACPPGTPITLHGTVYFEQPQRGVLVVQVRWRGRNYMGTLLDTGKFCFASPNPFDPNYFPLNVVSSSENSKLPANGKQVRAGGTTKRSRWVDLRAKGAKAAGVTRRTSSNASTPQPSPAKPYSTVSPPAVADITAEISVQTNLSATDSCLSPCLEQWQICPILGCEFKFPDVQTLEMHVNESHGHAFVDKNSVVFSNLTATAANKLSDCSGNTPLSPPRSQRSPLDELLSVASILLASDSSNTAAEQFKNDEQYCSTQTAVSDCNTGVPQPTAGVQLTDALPADVSGISGLRLLSDAEQNNIDKLFQVVASKTAATTSLSSLPGVSSAMTSTMSKITSVPASSQTPPKLERPLPCQSSTSGNAQSPSAYSDISDDGGSAPTLEREIENNSACANLAVVNDTAIANATLLPPLNSNLSSIVMDRKHATPPPIPLNRQVANEQFNPVLPCKTTASTSHAQAQLDPKGSAIKAAQSDTRLSEPLVMSGSIQQPPHFLTPSPHLLVSNSQSPFMPPSIISPLCNSSMVFPGNKNGPWPPDGYSNMFYDPLVTFGGPAPLMQPNFFFPPALPHHTNFFQPPPAHVPMTSVANNMMHLPGSAAVTAANAQHKIHELSRSTADCGKVGEH